MSNSQGYVTTQSITWIPRAKTVIRDRQGNDTFTETEIVMDGCVLWPLTSEERTSSQVVEISRGRTTTTSAFKAHIPAEYPVGENDKLRVSGYDAVMDGTYEVQGRPADFKNPWTDDEVKIVTANMVTG